MTSRLLAALLGAVGGLLLGAAGVLPFLAGEPADWHGTLAVAGYAVALGALVLAGYGLVAHAPVWLRIIVSIAVPLLAASVWQVVDQALGDRLDGWKGPATTHLLAGAILLVLSMFALRAASADRPDEYRPTHHR